MGIHISKRAYNQLELFVNSFPGNCYGMNADYDRFLTLGDAATCLMYKERIVHNEDTPLKIYYTCLLYTSVSRATRRLADLCPSFLLIYIHPFNHIQRYG